VAQTIAERIRVISDERWSGDLEASAARMAEMHEIILELEKRLEAARNGLLYYQRVERLQQPTIFSEADHALAASDLTRES